MSENGVVVMVKKDMVVACMTCPICNQLLNDATTICECLHTFCRKCINAKIEEEEIEFCPVCNIHLGCSPLEKLRSDHNLQDLRNNIFSSPRKRTITCVTSPPITIHGRRKERSLSSLVVSAPIIPPCLGKNLVGENLMSDANKSLDFYEDGDKRLEYHPNSSFSPKPLTKHAKISRQDVKHSTGAAVANGRRGGGRTKQRERKPNRWKPSNHMIEYLNRIKSPNGVGVPSQVCCEKEKNSPKLFQKPWIMMVKKLMPTPLPRSPSNSQVFMAVGRKENNISNVREQHNQCGSH